MTVDGVDYSPDGILQLRADLIKLRDAQMSPTEHATDWDTVTLLSHTIALLAHLHSLVLPATVDTSIEPR